MVQNLALVTDQYGRIPYSANTSMTPLIESNMSKDAILRAGLSYRLDFRSINEQTALRQPSEE